ncbi:type I-C CRISPR-associated protein Cas8c/Csd1 [Streptococcus loxodontisalivarius]|uniref:CRISPR-associated protein Csd1 n=1 Tax=Streptococcus loxodontisalivarius TaxID=1349415 RepID=A0ABS2PS41_9STRE|nr:type I-C CRISPR-associated protein Cas8c/Csd1 [Streptococcus loxodontisalivarius]MBM7642202.1 CRISPR-associated protein Csd1 [Streptococcus loxodontisalivarius]
MDFFTSLLNAYEKAEEIGLVDQRMGDNEPVLLPIYHNNKIIKKTDFFINIFLDNNGCFYKAERIEEGANIIFPITFESSNRTSTKIAPHPITDSWYYVMYSELRQDKQHVYLENLNNWITQTKSSNVKRFLEFIYNFVRAPKSVELVLKSAFGQDCQIFQEFNDEENKFHSAEIVYGENKKTIVLSKVNLTFTIMNYDGFKNISVSNFKELHNDHLKVIKQINTENIGICNISGKEDRIISLHRSIGGPFGKAKLISKSDGNKFAYQGDRFSTNKDDVDIIKIGYETSEKIHLMIKYLLENKNSSTWLGSSQYLINWFSDDLVNNSQLDIVKPVFDDLFEDDEDEEDTQVLIRPSEENREIGSSFIKGKKLFGSDATYYIAVLNKTSNGRIALKYFRSLQVSQLLKNLEAWQENYSWEIWTKAGNYKLKTPIINDIISVAYGVDRERYLEVDNDRFKSDQYQQLVTALIDGKSIPGTVVKKLEDNIRQRQKYSKRWKQVQQVSLGILHKQNGEEFSSMLDHTNQNRSYLFGRLLAIYELTEHLRYKLEGSDSGRITNAERYWTAYTGQPTKIMMLLENKIQPYAETLKLNRPGSWNKLSKEKEEIMELLNPLLETKSMEESLDYRFFFGYYAEKKFYYTKQNMEVAESEE